MDSIVKWYIERAIREKDPEIDEAELDYLIELMEKQGRYAPLIRALELAVKDVG